MVALNTPIPVVWLGMFRMQVMTNRFILSSLLALVAIPAVAWEADGFRSGDAIEHIEKELASSGIVGRPRVRLSDMRNAYSIPASDRWFSFCKDRLYGYERSFDVTLHSFAIALQTEIDRWRSVPAINTERQVRVGVRGIWFTWAKPGEEFLLILSQEEKGSLSATRRYEDLKLKEPCS